MNKRSSTERELVARASVSINAPVERVWNALIAPKLIKRYMFGTEVVSEWEEGSQIIWKGEWKGKSYQDKGVILKLKRNDLIQYSHFSPLSGKPDLPENYHTVTIKLTKDKLKTIVSLSQDNKATEDSRKHSEKNWKIMLEGLKELLETM
ncbi:MAG TPA: SRPBCC domain-containing protein [Candidatus Bathyarchaeia archaeon]|nr:SRPBCC domain-containing protein [Candidatus Bathyarchaeia archaeon]